MLRRIHWRAFATKRERFGGSREQRRERKIAEFSRKRSMEALDKLHQALLDEDPERELRHVEQAKKRRQERAKHRPVLRFDSPLYKRFGQHTVQELEELPLVQFDGPIDVIRSKEDEDVHAPYLERQRVLGIDTETRPEYSRNRPSNPIALVQVSTLERAFLYRLAPKEPLPPLLQALLEAPYVIKVGHSLQDDIRQLHDVAPIVASTMDTLGLAGKMGCVRPSLKNLSALFLEKTISKDMQVSDWAADELTQEQIRYAATDAYIPLKGMTNMEEARKIMVMKSYRKNHRTLVTPVKDQVLTLLRELPKEEPCE